MICHYGAIFGCSTHSRLSRHFACLAPRLTLSPATETRGCATSTCYTRATGPSSRLTARRLVRAQGGVENATGRATAAMHSTHNPNPTLGISRRQNRRPWTPPGCSFRCYRMNKLFVGGVRGSLSTVGMGMGAGKESLARGDLCHMHEDYLSVLLVCCFHGPAMAVYAV